MTLLNRNQKRALWKRLVIHFIPASAFMNLYNELKLLKIRFFSRLTYHKWHKILLKFQKPYKVNIASGEYGKEGWINLDCYKSKNIIGVFDLRKQLPLPSQSVKMIFCEHFLEHLDYYNEVPIFLRECYRVLIKGGILRLAVPNAVAYMQAYFQEGDVKVMSHLRNTDKFKTKMEIINRVFRQGGQHLFAYDQQTLLNILKIAGFEPSACSFGKSYNNNIVLDRPDRAIESIYAEGLKV